MVENILYKCPVLKPLFRSRKLGGLATPDYRADERIIKPNKPEAAHLAACR